MELKAKEFYGLVANSEAAARLNAKAQSYLFCGDDTEALLLLAGHLVEGGGGSFNSVDVKILPENGEKLVVADIDSITADAAITPMELKNKYYILKNGDTMNDAASNKLLKTLEEPPSVAKIIILSSDERAVLPTIRSRCRIVNLPPFDMAALNKRADEVFAGEPLLDKAKNLSRGSITRLIKAVSGGYEQAESAAFEVLLSMRNSRHEPKLAQLLLNSKDELSEIVDMLELILADAARVNCGVRVHLDYRTRDIAAISEFYSADTVIRLKPIFERVRRRIKFFGNAASVIDEFLFSLLEIRQKCQG